MRSLLRPADPGVAAPTRMIWLPGAFHTPEDFLGAGFDAEVKRRGLALDLEFVAVDLEHVGDRGAVERLARNIVAPARAGGCRSIWLGGISLGGFLALDYAASDIGPWDGLCLLAPYLGNRLLIAEISGATQSAGRQDDALAQFDEERRIWRFLRERRESPDLPRARQPLYLGYGSEDRFAPAHALMAASLPAGAVNVIAGGHDWPTWSTLWGQFLDSDFI